MAYKKGKSQAKMMLLLLQETSLDAFKIAKEKMQMEKLQTIQVKKALNYYLKGWRNVIHPGLIYLAGKAVDAKSEAITQTQVAMLLLTAAFDIHDDIIDKSLFKDKRATIFGKFGADVAILLGNAFLIKGFVELHNLEKVVSAEKTKEIFSTINETFFKLGEAHVLELSLRQKKSVLAHTHIDEYWRIVKMKASSFQADTKIGAIIGNALPYELKALAEYGQIIGELAILRDDFIDLFEIDELCHRIKNECLPMPILCAFQNKKAKKEIKEILWKEKITEKSVNIILDILFNTNEVRELIKDMQTLRNRGIKAIQVLRNSEAKQLARELLSAILENIETS
jgi:geranylgeranyl pyrophosphate synthase